MNRGEMRTFTSRLVEDPVQSKFKPDVYNDALEKAQQQFALDSKALYKDSAITIAADTAAYSLPADFVLEKQVVLNGIELKPISRATLQAAKTDERWDNDAGTPMYYVIDPEEARKTITLYPIPSSVSAGTSLVLTYYPFPATMSTDNSTPLNGSALMTQFHVGLCHFAGWLLMSYLPQTPEISQKRAEFYSKYQEKVTEAIQTFGNTKSEPYKWRIENIRVR